MNEVQSAVDTLVTHYGSYRSAAEAIGVNYAYLWRLGKGKKIAPSDEVLKKLGLVKSVVYSKPNGGSRKR